jgi:hypothetical protein
VPLEPPDGDFLPPGEGDPTSIAWYFTPGGGFELDRCTVPFSSTHL